MSDKLDPLLLNLFEEGRNTLADDAFLEALLTTMKKRRRSALWRQALVLTALVPLTVWQLPALLRATASAMQMLSDPLQGYALLLSPLGWAVSMLIGLGVIWRLTPKRT